MGANHSARKASFDASGEVSLDHFQILRAIGKGSFGKVCIVQKKDTKKMFAMKYMNKNMCLKKDAIRNVLREMELLHRLDHPFLVNLWFTFHDDEDMFMVVDLLLGGDLRYHIQQDIKFSEESVQLYICEIGLALEYLHANMVLHRDIKPDNILLDEEGHVHITDFNIATKLEKDHIATSMSGTKPYMAPEVFACALDQCPGYGFPVDWWSLGVCAFEMLRGKRPHEIHSGSSLTEVTNMFATSAVHYPSMWNKHLIDLLHKLLQLEPGKRLSRVGDLKTHPFMQSLNFDSVLCKKIKPGFVPPKDHLNCDPTYELEEMIIEAKPLHKKKKRLAKQSSKREQGCEEDSEFNICMKNIDTEFQCYNRERDSAENTQQMEQHSLQKQTH